MDIEKQIRILTNEIEILESDIKDLKEEIIKKDIEIEQLKIPSDSRASLLSQIAILQLESQQGIYNNELLKDKTSSLQIQNEQLENELVSEIKAKQLQQKVQGDFDKLTNKFNAISSNSYHNIELQKQIAVLQNKLSEAQSLADIYKLENDQLKMDIQNLKRKLL